MVDPVLLQELAKQALVYMSPLIAQGALKKMGFQHHWNRK